MSEPLYTGDPDAPTVKNHPDCLRQHPPTPSPSPPRTPPPEPTPNTTNEAIPEPEPEPENQGQNQDKSAHRTSFHLFPTPTTTPLTPSSSPLSSDLSLSLRSTYILLWLTELTLFTLSLAILSLSILLLTVRRAPALLRAAAGVNLFVSLAQILRAFVVRFRPREVGDASVTTWMEWIVLLGGIFWAGAAGVMLGAVAGEEAKGDQNMVQGEEEGGGIKFDDMPVAVWWVAGGLAGVAFIISAWQCICVYRLSRDKTKYPAEETAKVDEAMVRIINNKWVSARGRWKAKSRAE